MNAPQCPAWCVDHDGDDHYGQPIDVDAGDYGIQLGLEQHSEGHLVTVTGGGEWTTQLSLTEASERQPR